MVRIVLTVFGMALLIIGAGCSEQSPETQQQVAPAPIKAVEPAPVQQVLKVVVPDTVAGMWKSVRLAVRDQHTGLEDFYSVDVGGSFLLPEEQLRVTIDTFLPAFVMDGRKITSASNQPTNPAVMIVIREADKEVYSGWLFGLYPDTHAYQHPRYNFTLIGYKPAG